MLKSHKQCLALLCLAFFTPSRPFALSLLSLLTACLLFCPTKRGKARENACNMKRQWQSRTDREKERNERERHGEMVNKTKSPHVWRRATNQGTLQTPQQLLPPTGRLFFAFLLSGSMEQNRHKKHSRLALWQAMEKQKLTWTCPTDNWLKFGQGGGTSPARVALRRSRREGIVSVKR